MKAIKRFLILLVFLTLSPRFVLNQHIEGNGGNSDQQGLVREFLDVANMVIRDLEFWAHSHFKDFDIERFKQAVQTTKRIYPTDEDLFILVDGEPQPVDAKNNSSKENEPAWIKFNTPAWNSKNKIEKKALNFHEYSGVSEQEINHYNSSAPYKTLLLEKEKNVMQFKNHLHQYLNGVASLMLSLLSPDLDLIRAEIKDIKNGNLYKMATTDIKKPKGALWGLFDPSESALFQYNAKKLGQIRCVQLLSERLAKIQFLSTDSTKTQTLELRNLKMDEFIQTLPPEETDPDIRFWELRQAFAQKIKESLLKNYNHFQEELNQIAHTHNENMRQGCWSLPLGESVKCAMKYFEHMFQEDQFPQEVRNRQALLETYITDLFRKIDEYEE
ncbi:MAG: hypothetical protein HYW47_05840 [Deltaproteobacteria bacterium]|nr:hypothetical protein [Deltaproteobacteria bacterium]